MPIVAALFVFVALAAAAVALFGRSKASSDDERVRALSARFGRTDPEEARALLRGRGRTLLPAIALADSAWARSTASDLQRANIHLRPAEFLLVRVAIALAVLAAAVVIGSAGTVSVVVGLIGALIGYQLPAFYLRSARNGRIAKIEMQLIELLPSIASSLRSGFAFEQAVEAAAQQLGPPLAEELTLLLNDVRLGSTMDAALIAFGERVDSTDLDIALTAVLIQRTTGGNLAEVLEQAAETLRERERIRGDVQTFTAQQRMTGTILAVYPIVIGLVLLAIMPSVWSKLFTEPVGQIQLGIAFTLQIIGFITIRRSLRVDV